jgi:RNA polymerase sigma factor (sigma-70 family)
MTKPVTRSLSLLTDKDLITLIQTGHRDAQEAKLILLQRYKNLLLKTLTPYLKQLKDFKELHSTATYGFLIAIERFNSDKGSSLGSFARPYMIGLLSDYIKLVINAEQNESHNNSDSISNDEHTHSPDALENKANDTDLDAEADRAMLALDVTKFRGTLSSRENEVVEKVFYHGKTFAETAGEMGISKQRVNQIWNSIKEKGQITLKHFNK